MSTFDLNRRQFLTAGIGASALAALGIAGCGKKPEVQPSADISGDTTPAAAAAEDWLGSAPEIAASDIAKTEDTDLLIVGAGNAGLVAAATATDLGMKYILCDKSNAVQQTRHFVGAIGTRWQKEAGVNTDKGKLLNELVRYASGKASMDVWKVWLDESAETVEYLYDITKNYGMDLYFDNEGYDHPSGGTDFFAPPQQHMWYIPAVMEAAPPSLWGNASDEADVSRNKVLAKYIQEKGNEIRFGTKLVKLIREGEGRVTGAIFETKEGYLQINAKKGVLLATGGYGANPVMLKAIAPGTVEACTGGDYMPNVHGDGIKAAMWVGARKDVEAAPMIFDRATVLPGVDAGLQGEGMDAYFPAAACENVFGSMPFLKVNRYGKRFTNESCPYDWTAFAAAQQPGGVWCSIFDANAPADCAKFQVTGCAKIAMHLVQSLPPEAVITVFPNGQAAVDEGAFVMANSIDELAEKLQLPADELKKTIARYNELAEKGVDEDYGKEGFRLSKIEKAPFYGFWCGGSLLTTLDGLKINANMQVLDQKMNVIPGLYAAGDCSGSMFSGNYPEYLVGVAAGRTITEGRHAVKYIKANE